MTVWREGSSLFNTRDINDAKCAFADLEEVLTDPGKGRSPPRNFLSVGQKELNRVHVEAPLLLTTRRPGPELAAASPLTPLTPTPRQRLARHSSVNYANHTSSTLLCQDVQLSWNERSWLDVLTRAGARKPERIRASCSLRSQPRHSGYITNHGI